MYLDVFLFDYFEYELKDFGVFWVVVVEVVDKEVEIVGVQIVGVIFVQGVDIFLQIVDVVDMVVVVCVQNWYVQLGL